LCSTPRSSRFGRVFSRGDAAFAPIDNTTKSELTEPLGRLGLAAPGVVRIEPIVA
jgi:hypothetical protein